MPLPLAQLGATLLAAKLRNQQALDEKAAREAQFQAEMAMKTGAYLDRGGQAMSQGVRDVGASEERYDIEQRREGMQNKSLAQKAEEERLSRELAREKLDLERQSNESLASYRTDELGLRGRGQTFQELLGGQKQQLDEAQLEELKRWHNMQPSMVSLRSSERGPMDYQRFGAARNAIQNQLKQDLDAIGARVKSGPGMWNMGMRQQAEQEASAARELARQRLEALSQQFPGVADPNIFAPGGPEIQLDPATGEPIVPGSIQSSGPGGSRSTMLTLPVPRLTPDDEEAAAQQAWDSIQ